MIDTQKRARIMQRSIRLGHCICNPKIGCPCPTFREKDVCQCAGERLESALEEVALTKLVEKAGCASKISQSDLKRVLAGLPEVSDPNVLVGTNTCDDAGVYKLDDQTALVQTVDVFMPSVDDPYTFGQIAAANSLSDVYAMGGRPISALSIIGFPIETVDARVMSQMLRGGLDKMREAGVVVIGGHSINDKDPKFGYAVTGLIHPGRIVTNDKARPGDMLVLTKPLGNGIVSFAGQIGMASEAAIESASRWMSTLNRAASDVMVEAGVESATDVTGFGLLGHLGEMVRQSGVTAEVWADAVPILDGALELVARGVVPGGVERNLEFASQIVSAAADVGEDLMHILYDPQTSGGLLMAVRPEKVDALVGRLGECAAVIGMVTGESEGRIEVVGSSGIVSVSGQGCPETSGVPVRGLEVQSMDQEAACCCGGNGESEVAPAAISSEGAAEDRFMDFMREVNAEGAVSVRTKELIAVALSVAMKCEPCVKIHINKARRMGIGDDEIREAVWLAIAFGGAPTMMFYSAVMGEKA